jgi:hypothetical protein
MWRDGSSLAGRDVRGASGAHLAADLSDAFDGVTALRGADFERGRFISLPAQTDCSGKPFGCRRSTMMRWRKLRWCLAGALVCALAAPAQGRTGSDEQRAREVERTARRAASEGRNEEAIERFRVAWELFKDPFFQCNLGGLEAHTGRARDAAQSLSMCLRLLKPEDKRVVGERPRRLLKEVRAQVGALTVEANVPDAEVVVDGKVVGKLPLPDPIFLDPGSHRVEVKAPGYESSTRVAVMNAGTSMLFRMRLEPMRVEVAPPPPELAPSEPAKEAKEAKSPIPAPAPVAPVVSAKASVLIPAREGAEPPGAPARTVVILGGLGLGIAGAVVGTAGLMAAGAAREQAKAIAQPLGSSSTICKVEMNNPCLEVYDAMDKAVSLTAVGIVGIAVSTVGSALVVYELIQSGPKGRTATAHVTLVAAPGEGALRVTGSF